MDAAEQKRIEKELRARFAKPRYAPIFYLTQAFRSEVDAPVVAVETGERCSSSARSEDVIEGVRGGPGLVNRQVVRCVLSEGHDGKHSTVTQRIPLSRKFAAYQWR